jgi:hypothetical protein
MEEQYYLQDLRSVVGNSVLWWAVNDCGYTCDLRCARMWTKSELTERGYWEDHYKYKPWPKNEVDNLIQFHIDCQDLERKKNGSVYDNNPHTIVTWRKDLIK